jgi:PAS domain S-box-containing protein
MNQASLLVRKLNAQRVARWLAGFVFALGALALAGAAFDLPALSSLIPHSGSTLPDTGALFCASGLGVALFTVRKAWNGWIRVAGQALLALVALVGVIEIVQNLTGLDLGIGRVLPPGSGDPLHPGRMSPISALSFLLVGAGVLLGSKPGSRVSPVGQALLVAALLLSVHVLFGYAYGLESFYRPFAAAPMAFDTAVAFVLLAFSCLYSGPDRGIGAVFTDPGPSGTLLRRMLPALLLTPLLLGWAAAAGQHARTFGQGVATGLVSTGNAVLMVGFLAWLVMHLRGADQELRTAVDALAASERMFRLSFENAFVGMAHIDPERRWMRVNPRLADLLGYEPSKLLEKPLAELVHPAYGAELEEKLRALQEGAIEVHTGQQRWIARDGALRWFDVQITVRRSAEGEFRHFILVVHDVTAAKRTAEQLRIQARSLEAAGTGIVITDARRPDHPIVYVNSAFERLTGFDRREVIGKNCRILNRLARDQPELDEVRRALEEGRSCTVVLKNHAKDGRLFWNELTLSPVLDEKGAPTHYIGIQDDITERRRLAAEGDEFLRTALKERAHAMEAARARDVLLAIVSHELRSPLNSIRLWASLLGPDAAPDPATFGKAVMQIESSVEAQSRLIDDLLDVSRFASGKLELERERVDVTALAQDAANALRPTAEAKGVRLELRVPGEPAWVDGDRVRLAQVVRNLVENAIKFTPRGGRIELAAEVVGEELELRVADDGAGIAADHLPRIFEQFWQADADSSRRHGGLGLGLSIVKLVVERHGGRVSAASEGVGRGATFSVRLPLLSGAPAEALAVAGSASTAPSSDGDVLVVDDEGDTAEALALALRIRGVNARVAFDAESAIEAIASRRPQILVSDLSMPGMSGFDLIRQIREEEVERGFARIHALAITGRGSPSDRWRVRHAGFDAFLPKPVSAQAVHQWIVQARSQPSDARPNPLRVMVIGGEEGLSQALEEEGHEVLKVQDVAEAARASPPQRPDVLLVDLDQAGGGIEELVLHLRENRLSLFVVGITAEPEKPRDENVIDSVLEKPLRRERLRRTLMMAQEA